MPARGSIQAARPPERDMLVSVCRKCSGNGPALYAALKKEFKRRGFGKSVRIVKSSCLDICPKRAVAVAVADDRRAEHGVRYFAVSDHADPALVATAVRP